MSQSTNPSLNTSSECSSDDFFAICRAVVRAGTLMAAAGTGAYRVKEEMNRVGVALGLDAVHAEVTLNTVIATCQQGDQSRTLVGSIPAISVNAGRIAAMETLALYTPPGISHQEFNRQLDAIERAPGGYGREWTTLAAMMACAAFCFLNNGGWEECLGAAVGAGCGQYLRASLARHRLNQLVVTLLAGLLACLVYLGLTDLLIWQGFPSPRHEAGYTSSLLFLIPGFPLITAGLDLARLDLSAGISRLIYAVLVTTVASVGAWAVAVIFHLVPEVAPPLGLPMAELVALQLLASFCGVFGFACIFNTPLRIALAAASIGMIANTIRLHLVDLDLPLQVAAPIATLLVGLMAAWVSPRLRCPRIVLSVPAVLIMIPGTTAYRALVFANQGMSLEAMTNAYETMFIVAGIATGLACARVLTDRVWAFEDHMPGMKER